MSVSSVNTRAVVSDFQGKGPDNPLLAVEDRTARPADCFMNLIFFCLFFVFCVFCFFLFLKDQKPKFSVSKEMCFINISQQSDHYQVDVL